MFVLSFKNSDELNSFDKYYMSLVEIKYFDALIDNKPYFDQAVTKKIRSVWKAYWNLK